MEIYLSAYKKTCINLVNSYQSMEYPMTVTISVSQGKIKIFKLFIETYLWYPIILVVSCLLFLYVKMYFLTSLLNHSLCFSPFFYYILHMLLFPIIILLLPITFIIRTIFAHYPKASKVISSLTNILLMTIIITLVSRHSTHRWIITLIQSYPIYTNM